MILAKFELVTPLKTVVLRWDSILTFTVDMINYCKLMAYANLTRFDVLDPKDLQIFPGGHQNYLLRVICTKAKCFTGRTETYPCF